jgi:choline dehydrogenase-like flavoprotein
MFDSTEVGENLGDHLDLPLQWKLRSPAPGASIRSPDFNDPAITTGSPLDWHTTNSVDPEELKPALARDSGGLVRENERLLRGARCHLGMLMLYIGVPLDETLVTTYAPIPLPTSRGTINLISADISDQPAIDHNHDATASDQYRLRTAVRTFVKFMNTSPVVDLFAGEAVAPGLKMIHEESSDAEIDERLKAAAMTLQHLAGTANVGKVVDTEFRVERGTMAESHRRECHPYSRRLCMPWESELWI